MAIADGRTTPEVKKRRVFRWSFILVQGLFFGYIIGTIAIGENTVSQCSKNALPALCRNVEENNFLDAIVILVVFWVAVDVITLAIRWVWKRNG